MDGIIQISSSSLMLGSLISITFGIIILIAPKTLNYLVALYFILIGLAGLLSLFV